MSGVDDKKYSGMEAVLQAINKSCISLPEDKVRRNNAIINQIIEQNLIPKMKQQSQLFDLMYNRIFYGGSFYDGLKVGKPEEYDLDLLLSLPKIANPQMIESDLPGYVHLQLPDIDKLRKQPEGPKYSALDKLMDSDKFILTTKFRSWVEGLIQKTLNTFEKADKSSSVTCTISDVPRKFYIDTAKSGPAFTLKINGVIDDEKVVLNVDVVPSVKCSQWPESSDYRKNPCLKKTEIFIVPKEPSRDGFSDKYWRLSFPEQERELLNGINKMKPTIRLLKRLRDFQKHDVIASYYIKTIFLLSLEDETLNKCWGSESLSHCFMKGLELYENHLRKYCIPFYWNGKNNLLSSVKADTCVSFANKIKKIYNEINAKVELDPFVVTKYLLSSEDRDYLRDSVTLGAKVEKRVFASQVLHSSSNSSISTNLSEISSYKAASIMRPMDSLNFEILQNSFDAVDSTYFEEKAEEKRDIAELLKELRGVNARLAVLEGKVDDVLERQKRIEAFCGVGSMINGFANINFVDSTKQ